MGERQLGVVFLVSGCGVVLWRDLGECIFARVRIFLIPAFVGVGLVSWGCSDVGSESRVGAGGDDG